MQPSDEYKLEKRQLDARDILRLCRFAERSCPMGSDIERLP